MATPPLWGGGLFTVDLTVLSVPDILTPNPVSLLVARSTF